MFELVFGLLILAGISAFLALLLEIADSYLADYGEKHILINEQKDLLVQGGRPLLSTLSEKGIFVPSACGGRGTCAYCKVNVLAGGGPVLPTETPYLSSEELRASVRLSFQVKVKDDLKIQIPEELFLVKEFRVRVEAIRDLTPQIKGLHLKILSLEEGIVFKAGQYVQLEVPKYKRTSAPEYRAYSISSGPHDHYQMELVITKVEKGAVTTYVHDYLKRGEELRATGPFGEFYLRDSERDILLIATGSGLAPIRSILHQIESEGISRKTVLFFGAKTKHDLFYYEDLKAWEKSLPNFTFIPTLSRSDEEDHWLGEKGRVTHLIEKHIPENASLDAYLCGAPEMVDSCAAILVKKGIQRDRIFYDKFA